MNIEGSYALLASLSSNGDKPAVLETDDGRFVARAQALTDAEQKTLLDVGIRHDGAFTRLVIDEGGRVAAMATSDTDAEADALVRGDLRRKGITVLAEEPLLAEAVAGPKRTSILHRGDELSIRVKRIDDEAGGVWLQIRAYLGTTSGYTHPVLTEAGQLVCLVSGRTDQDAWQRVQGELNRQGIEFA